MKSQVKVFFVLLLIIGLFIYFNWKDFMLEPTRPEQYECGDEAEKNIVLKKGEKMKPVRGLGSTEELALLNAKAGCMGNSEGIGGLAGLKMDAKGNVRYRFVDFTCDNAVRQCIGGGGTGCEDYFFSDIFNSESHILFTCEQPFKLAEGSFLADCSCEVTQDIALYATWGCTECEYPDGE
ncbi:MAG: hypothetical protein AABW71_00765 [Nanoarchaeota archaeon]